jgi:hypothetical protein
VFFPDSDKIENNGIKPAGKNVNTYDLCRKLPGTMIILTETLSDFHQLFRENPKIMP